MDRFEIKEIPVYLSGDCLAILSKLSS